MCNDDDMQPNPRHQELTELLNMAEDMQEDIAEALKDAHRIMDGAEAWTGPTTAATFLEDLGYRHEDLPGIAQRLVDDIREALNSCPEEIPATPAPTYGHGGYEPV